MKNTFYFGIIMLCLFACNDDPCESINCLNGGECVEGTCICPDGFTGENCDIIIDACENINCLNGGECIEGTCVCPDGFTGENCETIICKQLKSISLNGEIQSEYEYNTGGNISKISYQQAYFTFEYRNDTIISLFVNDELNFEALQIITQLSMDSIKLDIVTNGQPSSNYSLLTELSESCGFEKEEFKLVANDLTLSTRTTKFTDDNCSNTSEVISNLDNTIIMSSSFTLDNKNNHYFSATIPYLQNSKTGNVVGRIEMDEDGNIDNLNSYNSTFIYGSDNYPIEENRTPINGGNIQVYTYEYY